MKIVADEVWVTPQSLIIRVVVWNGDASWRQKRYVSIPLEDIPEEAIQGIYQWYLDAQPEEDPHQTALF